MRSSGSAGQKFDLGYTCPQPGGQILINWAYNMYGSSMGTLRLKTGPTYVASDGAAPLVVWSKSGNQGTGWARASAWVPADSLVFEGERKGYGYYGDIAIDDVAINCNVACSPADAASG